MRNFTVFKVQPFWHLKKNVFQALTTLICVWRWICFFIFFFVLVQVNRYSMVDGFKMATSTTSQRSRTKWKNAVDEKQRNASQRNWLVGFKQPSAKWSEEFLGTDRRRLRLGGPWMRRWPIKHHNENTDYEIGKSNWLKKVIKYLYLLKTCHTFLRIFKTFIVTNYVSHFWKKLLKSN